MCEPEPRGAIPAQLELALSGLDEPPPGATLKLYNASNFFDRRAVPIEDWQAIAKLAEPFDRVTVESHPRMIDDRARDFGDLLRGRLEVAVGLETVHAESLSRLNKEMTIDDFDRAAEQVVDGGFDLRVFVLVGAPWIPQGEMVHSVVRTVEHAFDRGARVVSLIAVRDGNGTLETLEPSGRFARPSLTMFEQAVERSNKLGRGVVVADLWDVTRLRGAACCFSQRVERLRRINLTGVPGRVVVCDSCGRS
ncbi:MAG: radical SAM protein [Acidobacteriota bacterium]